MNKRVDFMVIGAQKSGTTTLALQLDQHPEISFCRIKEPGYFSTTENWAEKLDEYHALYDWSKPGLRGEGSTMYTFLPEHTGTHQRLHAYNPDLKLIYIMRNPVDRIISNYTHRLVRSTVQDLPEQAVFARPEYINRSRYGVQLRPYLELFGSDQLLLLIFEEYVRAPERTLAQIAAFLDIDAAGFALALARGQAAHRSVGEHHLNPVLQSMRTIAPVDRMLNSVPSGMRTQLRKTFGKKLETRPEFSPELRRLLWQFLEDDVSAVEGFMQRPLDIWRQDIPT